MRARRFSPLLVYAVLCVGNVQAAVPLEICIDQSNWYPLTYSERGEARGVHVDVIRCALDAAGFRYRIRPLPWPRCLRRVGAGEIDAAATASFTEQRAATLIYPDDAARADHSRWAVGYADDVVVTAASSGYIFRGDVSTLPQPVRVPRGWAIADTLRARGIRVDAGAVGDSDDFRKLLRDRRGSVVATSVSVQAAFANPEFATQLEVQALPLHARSYHLVFSRSGDRIEAIDRQRIWDQIATIRDDRRAMALIESRYADSAAQAVTHAGQPDTAAPDCGLTADQLPQF